MGKLKRALSESFHIIVAAAVAMLLITVPLPTWAALNDSCPTYTYLGNSPNDSDAPDWSEQAQGVANDGEHWFFTHQNKLFKYDAEWKAKGWGDDNGKIKSVGIPGGLEDLGINHFGDLDHYGGYLFVPFEGQDIEIIKDALGSVVEIHITPISIIAVFRATDLVFVDSMDVTAHQTKLGWLAIDPVTLSLYSSGNTLSKDLNLLRYHDLDITKVENGIIGDFLRTETIPGRSLIPSPPMQISLFEKGGEPLIGKYTYMQGGVFTPWGDLFLSAGKADDSASDTNGGLHLFRKTDDETVFRHIKRSLNDGRKKGVHDLVYTYVPSEGVLGGLEEEPEGIDWWNRDNVTDSSYPGQLHAILLDNEIFNDNIWLKHYRVNYSCVTHDDADGDGVTDGDEVYVNNTHPLLADYDHDGVDDSVDNCPAVANPKQSDLDFDGKGDLCDGDADGDGQRNIHEQVCGSDSRDAHSLSPDLDSDNLPNCVDKDDDGDGQKDIDESACGSNPQDALSLSLDSDNDNILDCLDPDDDNDGVNDASDNCPLAVNPDQANFDGDDFGNVCDVDDDNDNVVDTVDSCLDTELGRVVDPNVGCSIAQLCPCEGSVDSNKWKNHGKYVRCTAKARKRFFRLGLITVKEKRFIRSMAKKSSCRIK